jgi:riboflavin kinase/FMN adenylyltransferase
MTLFVDRKLETVSPPLGTPSGDRADGTHHGDNHLACDVARFAHTAGIVIPGDRRGRELGYPTANVAPDTSLDLPDGVFAGTVLREDSTLHLSAVSVGTRETFYADSAVRLIEAYLLDFDDQLYGELIEISLYAYLRDQQRFDDLDELIAQIASDVSDVRAIFEGQELIAYGISSSATEH